MTKKEITINPVLYGLIKKCEVKRINENVTKRELTDLIDIHYMFYYNCVVGSNNPSPNMVEAINTYLNTPTKKVYETLFARRASNLRGNNKKRDEHGKELFHEKLLFHDGEVELILAELTAKKKYTEPKDHLAKS